MHSCDTIETLSAQELDQVDGAVLPLIPIAYAGIGLSATVLVAGYSWVAGVTTGYSANRQRAN